jgi:signal transduction histidine kinase
MAAHGPGGASPVVRLRTPVAVLLGGVLGALVAAGLAGLGVRDTAALVAMAGGSAALVLAGTVVVLSRLRHRSLATQLLVVSLGAVAGTAAGVGVAGWAMFLSAHDLGVLTVVLVLSVAVAASGAWVLGHRVGDSVDVIGSQIDALASDAESPPTPPSRLVTAELQRLSDVLERTHLQLIAARRRAARLEESRRELVAWVSHDLRSPIGAVRAMAEALEDGVVTDPVEVAGYHRAVRQETERLSRLVDDLFELSRIEAGVVTTDVPFVPLHELVGEVVEAAAGRADAQGIILHSDLEDVGPELVVAADVRRALDNILDNAIRHTPTGGSVTASARADGAFLELLVTDQCGGIPAGELDRVFEVAFRGDGSRSRDTGGGGLGLAIAKGLLESRSGKIAVRNLPGGCQFAVRLPARTSP